MCVVSALRCLLWLVSPGCLLAAAGFAFAAPAGPAPAPIVAPFTGEQAVANQELWAKYLKMPVKKTDSVGVTMILIPPGEFMMGSTPEQVAEAQKWCEEMQNPASAKWSANRCLAEMPQHPVTLTRPMLFGATPVTVGEFRRFIQLTNYVTETERRGGGNSMKEVESNPQNQNANWSTNRTDQQAVGQVTWNDAVRFCQWLSVVDKLKPAYRQVGQGGWQLIPNSIGYRLPTEAEWEYACRAGTTTQFWFGDARADVEKYTFDPMNPPPNPTPATAPPNPFGLYDMTGLTRQWCQDFYADDYYGASPSVNPPGPADSTSRAIRGTWLTGPAAQKRSAFRFSYVPHARFTDVGFRVARYASLTPATPGIGRSSSPAASPAGRKP